MVTQGCSHFLKLPKSRGSIGRQCTAKFGQISLDQQLMQGLDRTDQLAGVLNRYRQITVGVVADIEAMFHQFLVDLKDCDTF